MLYQLAWWFSCYSVTQSCPTLCSPMDCSMPGFPVLHHLLELAQTHVHWVGDAIQPSCLLTPSTAFSLSQHQWGMWKWKSLSWIQLFVTPWTVYCIQARILKWIAFLFSSGSSRPRNQTGVSCIAGGFFTNWAIREALPASGSFLISLLFISGDQSI